MDTIKLKGFESCNVSKECCNNEIDYILERYKRYQIARIDKQKDDDIDFIRESSDVGKIVNKLKTQAERELNKIYPDGTKKKIISIFFGNTEKMQEDIDKILEARELQLEKLVKEIEDARALIQLANLFEEKMKILENYNIIDGEGKIKSW